MDMDDVIIEDMAQAEQIWRKQERKETRKYKDEKSIGKYVYNYNFAVI